MIPLARNVQNDERILANMFRIGGGREAHGPSGCFALLQLIHNPLRVNYAILGQVQEKLWHGFFGTGVPVALPVGALNDTPAELLAEAIAT